MVMQPLLLDLIKTLCELYPVVFQGVLVFELFPWSAGVRTMDNRVVGKQIVRKAQCASLLRDGYVEPVFLGVERVEIIRLEQVVRQ